MKLSDAAPRMPLVSPCAACGVRDRAMCAVLEDGELQHIARSARGMELDTGKTVFFEGDAADNMFVLISGALKLYKLLADGRRQITGFLYAGDFLGLAFNDVYQYTAEALKPTRLCRLPRHRVEDLLDDLPHLAGRLLNLTSTDLAAAQGQMLLLGRKTATERLASFLLQLSVRVGARAPETGDVHLPMSRADIADFLGLKMETVSRGFSKLKASRLISLREGGYVMIRDPAGLAAIAGDV